MGNMLIPISSGVQKIVDDSKLSTGCGGPVLSLSPNYQHLAGQLKTQTHHSLITPPFELNNMHMERDYLALFIPLP